MGIVSLNSGELKVQIIKHLYHGYTVTRIANILGIDSSTISLWKNKDAAFAKRFRAAEDDGQKLRMIESVDKIAHGTKVIETTQKYSTTKVLPCGKEVPVEMIYKERINPPDINALKMLAAKYAKGEYKEDNEQVIEVRITQKDRALSMDERKRILERDKAEGAEPIDTTWHEVVDSKSSD